MQSDLISVVIPTYNRADCICNAIDSVRAQSYGNWEILVVDDGSTDSTPELIQSRYGHDTRIRYMRQANAGVSNARNTGIAHVTGNLVAFLDSDDRWKPWKLGLQLAFLQARPEVGMVWTDMEAVNSRREILDARHLRTMYSAYRYFQIDDLFESSEDVGSFAPFYPEPQAKAYRGDIYASMILGSLVHTSTVLIRKERLDRVGGFSEDLLLSGEDYDFHLRTCKWGSVGLIDVASIEYTKGRSDHLSDNSTANAVNFLVTVERAIEDDRLAQRFPADRIRQVLAHAHGWVAEEHFKAGNGASARRQALRSLRFQPIQPRLIALAALSSIPSRVKRELMARYRQLKKKSPKR